MYIEIKKHAVLYLQCLTKDFAFICMLRWERRGYVNLQGSETEDVRDEEGFLNQNRCEQAEKVSKHQLYKKWRKGRKTFHGRRLTFHKSHQMKNFKINERFSSRMYYIVNTEDVYLNRGKFSFYFIVDIDPLCNYRSELNCYRSVRN